MEKTEQPYNSTLPSFDSNFKVILRVKYTDNYFEKLFWLNNNSIGKVEIKILREINSKTEDSEFFFGFENPDDAILFRIKYETGF